MSTHIKELEQESGLDIYGRGAKRDMWEAAMKKFARLIVEDCQHNMFFHGYDDAANQLEWFKNNRFGDKE